MHALGITWRNLGGVGKLKVDWVHEFLALLKDTDIKIYTVMDDDAGVKEELERLVRQKVLSESHYYIWQQGRKRFHRNPDVGSEFEDNFSNEQLIETAKGMAQDEGIELDLSVDGFARRCRNPTKKTSKVLADYCWQQGKYPLSKPELNRRLAVWVSGELASEEERTREYEFEKVARDIFKKLG